jgi:phosphoribosylformimino-5-aminoimidazole carboxamide ribotide isomerase
MKKIVTYLKKMIKIIPAIDLIDGQCVRLTQGDYSKKKVYGQNPVELAKQFEANGLKYLHLVDLDGAKSGSVVNWNVLENICRQTSLLVDFGGGIKTSPEIEMAFNYGANQVNIGSVAVKNKELFLAWLDKYGSDKLILGADVKNESIAIHGWQQQSGIDVFDFIEEYLAHGIEQVVCTDISKDGTLQGPAFGLYQKLLARFSSLQLTASGGISGTSDIDRLIQLNLTGIIIGKALYENKIGLKDLQAYL